MLENQRNDETENRYLQLCLGCKFCTAEYALVKPAVRCVGMNLKIFVSYQTYFPKKRKKIQHVWVIQNFFLKSQNC